MQDDNGERKGWTLNVNDHKNVSSSDRVETHLQVIWDQNITANWEVCFVLLKQPEFAIKTIFMQLGSHCCGNVSSKSSITFMLQKLITDQTPEYLGGLTVNSFDCIDSTDKFCPNKKALLDVTDVMPFWCFYLLQAKISTLLIYYPLVTSNYITSIWSVLRLFTDNICTTQIQLFQLSVQNRKQ